MLDTSIGPIHYGAGEDQEIDTAWQATTGAWDWEMTTNNWQTYARDTFNAGDIFEFQKDGEWVRFDPQSINWIDENNSRQQIAIKQAVAAVVNDDIMEFPAAYGSGRHFQYQNQTARLQKLITIDADTDLPAVTLQGNTIWFEAEFTIAHSSGVEVYLDGQLWQKENNVRVQTADRIEFRDAATGQNVFWHLDFPRALDSSDDGNETIGQMEVRRQGGPSNLFITVRIPKTWLDGAVFPVFLDPTIDPQVSASADDAHEQQNDASFTSSATRIRLYSDTAAIARHVAGFRFQCTGPASGDTIDAAYISVTADATTRDDANVDIYCEDVDNAADFSTTADVFNRTTTAGSAAWVQDGLGTSEVNSPSIVAAVEDVITDRAGWSSGNYLMVLVWAKSDTDKLFRVYSYDGSTSLAADLHIEYTAAGGGDSTPYLSGLRKRRFQPQIVR
jgi:hypothetical protein